MAFNYPQICKHVDEGWTIHLRVHNRKNMGAKKWKSGKFLGGKFGLVGKFWLFLVEWLFVYDSM